MKENRCPICGKELSFGEACYHDESLRQRLIGTFYGLKAMGEQKTTPSISFRKVRIAYILEKRYKFDIYNNKTL